MGEWVATNRTKLTNLGWLPNNDSGRFHESSCLSSSPFVSFVRFVANPGLYRIVLHTMQEARRFDAAMLMFQTDPLCMRRS
jgi:hypothetical protein